MLRNQLRPLDNPRLAYDHMSFTMGMDGWTSATVVTSESLRILSTEAFRDVFQRCGLTYQG